MKYFQLFMAVFAMSIIFIACNTQHPQQMRVQNDELETTTADTTALGAFNTPQTSTEKNEQNKLDSILLV